jgi:hypothetical protein
VVVAALFGWIWFKPAVDRLQTDLDACRRELADLNRFVRETTVPAITESNETLRRVAEILPRRRAG